MNSVQNSDHAARTYERFVSHIVKLTISDYQTWQTHFLRNSEVAQRFVGSFLDCAFRMLIGWAGNLRSHGSRRNTLFGQLVNLKCCLYRCIFAPLRTPLHAAALNDQVECLQLLLSRGGEVNVADSSGRTPLLVAAHNGHAGAVGEIKRTSYFMHLFLL